MGIRSATSTRVGSDRRQGRRRRRAGAAATGARCPKPRLRAAPRSSRRVHGPCSRSSASRSTTRATSPAPGPGGRILDRDVTAWAAGRDNTAAPPAAGDALTVARTIPLRGRRGTIARRMVSSLQTAAQLTSVLELDVTPLVELRSRMNGGGAAPRIGVTAIVVKVVAAALREHPGLNARVTEDAIELLDEVNVAIAVETDEGLIAPVVRGADQLSLEEMNHPDRRARRDVRAIARRPADDLEGATFTVSNGGIHPVDITTAILNPPQVGILWIGRIRERPIVTSDGRIAVRPTMQACLTFDHRAVDGGPAAAFLATLDSLVARLPEPHVMTIDAATLHGLYRTMLTIRLFEQRVSRAFRTGEIPGFVHMYIGEEAVAAGVCANLDDSDYVTSTHRGHGHCIAKGCELGPMMAEIYGREDGLCKGRGGSMHIADFSRGMLGANAIVGGGIALATGAGLASSVRASGQVAVAFFGDGAANQGVLHESLNLAAIWKLPVLYVCENNGFAESTPRRTRRACPHREPGRRLRNPGCRRRRRRCPRGVRRCARRGRPSACRRGPDAARGQDVPPLRALRG